MVYCEGTYQDWLDAGSKTPGQHAAEKIERVLAEHQVEPLPRDAQTRIGDTVEHAG